MSHDPSPDGPAVDTEGRPISGTLEHVNLEAFRKDLLWGMYLEVRTQGRHAETLRASGTSLALAIGSGLVAVITADGDIDRADLPLSVTIIALSAFSALFSASYVER